MTYYYDLETVCLRLGMRRPSYSGEDVLATAKLYHNQEKGKTMQPKCEWGFTDKPDFARICRELASQGAAVGRVSMKGESRPVTLVKRGTTATRNVSRLGLASAGVTGAPDWLVISGDHVQALLAVAPVKVEGWASPDLDAAEPAPPVAPPPTAWVRRMGVSHDTEYLLGEPLNRVLRGHVPTAGNAYLGLDGKVYMFACPGRKLIGYFVPAPAPKAAPVVACADHPGVFCPKPTVHEPYGIFCKDGSRSIDYPVTYRNQADAAAALKAIPAYKHQANGYFARAL